MVITTNEYEFIKTDESLTEYLANHHKFVQMRFPAITSLNGERAVILIVPHMEREYVLLVPYDILKSHISKTIVPSYNKQTVRQIVASGLLREAGLRMKEMELLGSAIEVENTLPATSEPHIKHIVLVTKYYRRPEEEPYARSEKIGVPVWVQMDLLPRLFNAIITMEEGKEKMHPHREAYRRYQYHLQTQVLEGLFE